MKWIPQDIDTFTKAKEFVDTAVIPLVPLDFGEEMRQSAAMSEFIAILTSYLEKQYTGRIVLIPSFTYLKTKNKEELLLELLKWKAQIVQGGFKHIFYITSDIDWKDKEDSLETSLLWMPTIPLENMDDSQKMTIIESQGKQLLNLFIRKWQEAIK